MLQNLSGVIVCFQICILGNESGETMVNSGNYAVCGSLPVLVFTHAVVELCKIESTELQQKNNGNTNCFHLDKYCKSLQGSKSCKTRLKLQISSKFFFCFLFTNILIKCTCSHSKYTLGENEYAESSKLISFSLFWELRLRDGRWINNKLEDSHVGCRKMRRS